MTFPISTPNNTKKCVVTVLGPKPFSLRATKRRNEKRAKGGFAELLKEKKDDA